ncbi:MAG: glycosyltransferase family 39 protein [Chloroflexota bacterium]
MMAPTIPTDPVASAPRPAPAPRDGAGARWPAGLASVGLLLLLFALVLTNNHDASLTADEPVHILRGYTLWRTGDYRLQGGHPPLAHLIMGWGLLLDPTLPAPSTLPGWEQANWDLMVEPFFAGPREYVDRLVWVARYSIALLAPLLGAAVFRWVLKGPAARSTRRLWAALLALALLALDPNVIAHAGLGTTDFAITTFFLLSAFSFERALRRPSPGRVAVAGLLFGLAQCAKFSAVILAPAFVVIALLKMIWIGKWQVASGKWQVKSKVQNPKSKIQIGQVLLAVFVVGGLTVWAVYRFTWGAVDALSLALPAPAYWRGLIRLNQHQELGHAAYLLGHFSQNGWWYYFPVAFLVKTPLPTLIAWLLAAVWWLRSAASVRLTLARPPTAEGASGQAIHLVGVFDVSLNQMAAETTLWIPALALIAISLTSSIDVGYRHILPVLPLTVVFIGQAVATWQAEKSRVIAREQSPERGVPPHLVRLRPVLLSALVIVWLAVESFAIQPHALAYFNQLAGGPANGYHILLDSNLDWGQELKRLGEFVKEEDLGPLVLSYFTAVDPAVYGIQVESPVYYPFTPGPGLYALSANDVAGFDPQLASLFRYRTPFAQIGYALWLYRVGAGEWAGVCATPAPPVDHRVVQVGLGDPPLGMAGFDCRTSWLFRDGGKPGWYVIPLETDRPTLVDRFLPGAEMVYHVPRLEHEIPYTIYYWSGGSAPAATPLESPTNFDNLLTLLGYRLAQEQVSAGEMIELDTYWQITDTRPEPLSIFAHLVAPDGQLAGTGDGLGVPPESWRVGDILIQTHTIGVPADAPAGDYGVQIGLYAPADGQRLPIRDGGSPAADYWPLVQVNVIP